MKHKKVHDDDDAKYVSPREIIKVHFVVKYNIAM